MAGGFGLYLKQQHLETLDGEKTLINGELWPPARATEDMDLILTTDFVLNVDHMRAMREVLDDLGYVPVVEHFQFEKETGRGSVKVDLLTGPITPSNRKCEAKINPPRVRPKENVALHAYLTLEAIAGDQGAMLMAVKGNTSDGKPAQTQIRILGPFTLLLMKLHAFHDRKDDARQDFARHHALDLYRIVAMLTNSEFNLVEGLVEKQSREAAVQRAKEIAKEFFLHEDAMGILRIQTYVRDKYQDRIRLDLDRFTDALRDLFHA